MNKLRKELDTFPNFMIEGNTLQYKTRRLYLQYNESFSTLIIIFIFTNYMFLCNRDNYLMFRTINTFITSLISADFLFKIILIRTLYLNKYYYGIKNNIYLILSLFIRKELNL